jgi:ATP-dependent Zn protease
MFWGVDVLRVLNYLSKCRGFALRHGACIAFIDEIDSIGSSRGAVQGGGQGQFRGPMGFMGGTGALTTLLAQMDGIGEQREFTTCRNIARKWLGVKPVREGFVMFVGSTNRPDVLDSALTRPGRLDRRIQVDPPDGPGRKEIFGGYLKKIKHAEIDLNYLVANTQGMTPAAIAMAVTRDAVRNARFRDSMKVEQHDIEMALMEQVIGMPNPIGDLDPIQKRQIAVHEAGHAVTLHYLNPDKRIAFLSIVRRELGLGLMLPVDVKATYTIPLKRLIADIRVSLAGDVAVEVCFGERWTGGAKDFAHVRDRVYYLAWHGVFGPMLNVSPTGDLPKGVAEYVSKWLIEQREATKSLLVAHKNKVETLADALVEKENLTADEVAQIMEANQ